MYGYEIFHDSIMEKLINSVKNKTHGHAYIFKGEKGIGKLEAARLFANALVCQSDTVLPCGTCSGCIQAKAKTNPDIKYIDTGDKKSIGVETIREINDDICIKPFGIKSKVYIITDGSLMTEAAQNAFLKTLEEPPRYAVFIILCEDMTPILQTIVSRCSVISFGRVEKETIRKYAENKYGSDYNLDFLVSFSQGNPGIIDRYINDEDFRLLRENSVKMLKPLLSSDKLSSYTIADFLEKNKDNVEDILNFWIILVRDILLISSGAEVINSDILKFLNNQAAIYDERYLINAAEILNMAHEMCKRYVNNRALALYLTINIKKNKT